MLSVSVLGPIAVVRDGVPVTVPGGKTSELLVRLALEAGEVVRTDRIVDDLWGEGAISTQRNTLQSKVTKLRRALGEPSVVISTDGGYLLAVEPSDVDALSVASDVATASGLLVADAPRVAEVCTSALTRFVADVLPAAGDAEWVTPHRTKLAEARMTLIETNLAARLRMGHVAGAIGELEVAVEAHPYREGLWELLITALYRVGRQADALATYQRVRKLLADELGLDPGPQLRRLEQQILTQDGSLLSADGMTRAFDDTPAGNLPSIAGDLIGRETEIDTVIELLTARRLVEIVGPGGVGKTALAIAVGRQVSLTHDATSGGIRASGGVRVSGGVWLARLETAVGAHDVVDALVAALNVGGEAALFERLRASSDVIILDNCEHVLDGAADLAVRLLDVAPALRVLCTSQVALDVDGEALYELAPLALADAVQLFTRRANAQRRRPTTNDADDATRDLCRSLDGLPLAIELAAARTRTLSVEEITRRLDDRFTVLSDPTSRRSARRRELKATIRWSYELLFPDDQRGLWALATFAGGAPLAAVESVLGALDVPAAAALDVVGRLAGRSLLVVDGDGSSSQVRYRLLDSIRAFALQAMSDAGFSERGLATHAAWFADAAGISTAGVRSSRQAEHLAFARDERANIDAALTWSNRYDPRLALGIVNGFGWAWVVLGDSRGAQRMVAALDACGDHAPERDRAEVLLLAAWIEASTGQLDLAREHIGAAERLAHEIGDVDLQARSCYYLAYVVSHEGQFRRALELTDRADALYGDLDRPWDQAANWMFATRAAISAGDHERSVEALDQVARWLESVDDPWLHVRFEAQRGELARIEHRFDDAVLHMGQAAETSRRLGFRQTEAYQVASLGRAQCQAGDYAAGATTLELAVAKAEATGDVRMAALARVHLGRVLRARGQREAARAALESAVAWHRAVGGGEQAALGEGLLAALDGEDGVPGAGDRLAAVLGEARRDGAGHVEVFALDALARLALDAGDVARATQLCEAADRRMASVSHFITEEDRTDAHAVRQHA